MFKVEGKDASTPMWRKHLLDYPWTWHIKKACWARHADLLLEIERDCFDVEMQASSDKLKSIVEGKGCLVVLLYIDKQAIGYMSGMPLESRCSSFDPETDPVLGWGEHNTFYVDNICIKEKYRSSIILKYLITEYAYRATKQGFQYATAHVRCSNGLAVFLRRGCGFTTLKTIDNWFECNETFDYMHNTLSFFKSHELRWHRTIAVFKRLLKNSIFERWIKAYLTS